MPPHEYVQLLRRCVGPHLGFPRTLQLVTGPTEVHTEVRSVGARFTSIGEQLVLQDALMLMGRELVAEQAEGGEDGDLGKMARALKDRPLHFIQQLQHAVSDSRSYVHSAKRLAQMRHTVELGVQLDGDAHLELFDWMRSAVALARRPADGFVGDKAQASLSFYDAVMSITEPQLFPALLGWLPEEKQPSRSPKEAEALRAATETLWQHLHARVEL